MHPELTSREIEIIKLIAGGLSNREIAFSLSISESTVENHIHNIYGKLDISKRAQAIAFASRQEWYWQQKFWKNRGNPSCK